MIKYFARASSLERRFLIGAALVVFLLFNYLFVWPRFSEWSQLQWRDAKARSTLKTYQEKIARKHEIEVQIGALERAGGNVPAEDQASDFIRTIQNQAATSGLVIQSNNRMPERTNQFFVERAQALTFTTTDQPLVDFLYNLSAGNSLVRVRGLSLRPDPPHYTLNVNVTLVGSYQKKVTRPPAPSAPAAAAKAPAAPSAPEKAPARNPDEKKSSAPAPAGVPKPSTPPKK